MAAKHTIKYWQVRLTERPGVQGLYARIAFQGKSHWWPLGTSEKETAATKARDIWLSLQTVGLQKTLEVYKPKSQVVRQVPTTLGEWINAVRPLLVGGRMQSYTFDRYAGYARTVMAELVGKADDGRKHCVNANPEMYHAWIAEIDAFPVAKLSEENVKGWLQKRIEKVATNPVALASAKRTLNSMIASLRSLFDGKLVSELRHVPMPDPPPFHGIPFYEKGDCKYVSRFNPELLLIAAKNSLKVDRPEVYKSLLLALCAGLRRHEIDLLQWDMMDWAADVIRLHPTELLSLKTVSSAKPVWVDSEVMGELRSMMGGAKGRFVIECPGRPEKSEGMRLYYRCEPVFDELISWLRDHGVSSQKPIHELRKEFISTIVNLHGIFAGSEQGRHSNIRTTAGHYASRKQEFRAGMGTWLTPQGKTQSDQRTEELN